MRKFLLSLLILGILAVATVIAAVPIFTKVVGPEMMGVAAPPVGLPLGARDFPLPERSVVSIKLELPVAALAEKANESKPAEFNGTRYKNFHRKISEGVTNWCMTTGTLSLANTGSGLAFQIPIRCDAESQGRFGALKIPVKGTAGMTGAIRGDLSPRISPEWEVKIPELTPTVAIHQAQIVMGKRGEPRDARAEMQAALAPMIQRESAKIGPSLTEALNLKPGVKKLWDQGHITKRVSNEPATWIVFDPGLVEMSHIDYSNPSSLSVTVGLIAQSFITNTEPADRLPDALPSLQLVREKPVTDIRVPLIVDYAALNESLSERTFNVKTQFGPTILVSRPMVEPGSPGYLNLTMDTRIPAAEIGQELSARIRVHAKPIVDCLGQTLGFVDVSLSVETQETLTGALAWLMDEMLVKAIEREVRIDLKEYLPELEDEIYKVITSAPVPDDIELSFDHPRVSLLGAYTVEKRGWNEGPSPGIVFVMGATGNIEVKVTKM